MAAGVGLSVLLRRAVYGRSARREAPPAITGAAKAYAVLSLLVWIAAITTGRFMAYVSGV